MYSNNIGNFQESTTILNACTKKSGNLLNAPHIHTHTHTYIYMYIYMLRTSIDKIKENGLEVTKKRSRTYFAKTITNADYADDIVILANAPA